MTSKALEVGDRVTVGQTELMGTVMFLGSTEFASGEWLGIELDEKAGKNDGSVKGKKYFDCKPEYGIFVRPTAAVKMEKPEAPPLPQPEKPQQVLPVSRGSQSLAPPPVSEKAKRVSHGERSLGIQKAGAQLELAQAMEDHDVDTIRRVLPVASNLGVDAQELEAARRILSFETQQNLFDEVDMLRSTLSQLAESVSQLEGEEQRALSRLGPELEKRVWSKVLPSIDRIVTGIMAKARQDSLEAYTFDHFDLDRDGYISRAEFDEVRSCILKGEPLPTQVKAGVQPQKEAASHALQPPGKAAAQAPRKDEVGPVLCRALCRSVYARAAVSQKALARGDDHYAAVRCCVHAAIRGSAIRAAQLDCASLSRSVEEKHAAARTEIASIKASKQRIEAAEKRAEQQLHAASTRVQACARGKLARQQKQALEASTRTLQRGFRRLRQRWREGRKMDFAAVVRAVKGRRRDWALEFHAEAKEQGLDASSFVRALQKVDHQISTSKVEKLWRGFESQSEDEVMQLHTFWAICEAISQGDEVAAEFADMSLEDYLEGPGYSEDEVQAALRIQAAQRARLVRVDKAQKTEAAAAAKIQAAFYGRLQREQEVESYADFAAREEERLAAAYKIQAAFQGRAQREQDAACADADEAATKIQAAFRGKQLREAGSARQDERLTAGIFREALASQGSGSLLLQPGFVLAMSKATTASQAQAAALFRGCCEGTEMKGVSGRVFEDLVQAVLSGDDAAAQFADLHLEDYRKLA